MISAIRSKSWTFYALAAFFCCYVLFIYGPMFVVFVLSFQGQTGGLTLPMQGFSFHWYKVLFSSASAGDIAGAFRRSLQLAVIVMIVNMLISLMAGLAYRKPFRGATFLFYMAVSSLIIPGILIGLGIGLLAATIGFRTAWYTTALGAQLTWTLPFGLLIMFAIFGRFNRVYEEVAADLGASYWQRLIHVVVPILLPGMIAVALFGFTLSYDEFARSMLTSGADNTLPLEIWALMTNVTTPALYAIGTLTTAVSFVVIAMALTAMVIVNRKRTSSSK